MVCSEQKSRVIIFLHCRPFFRETFFRNLSLWRQYKGAPERKDSMGRVFTLISVLVLSLFLIGKKDHIACTCISLLKSV